MNCKKIILSFLFLSLFLAQAHVSLFAESSELESLAVIGMDVEEAFQSVSQLMESTVDGNLQNVRNALDEAGYVRAAASDILVSYSNAASDISLINSKANAETEELYRNFMKTAAVRLSYKLRSNKSSYVISTLSGLTGVSPLPFETFYFMAERAKELGLSAVIPSLETIRSNEEEVPDEYMDQSIEILQLNGQFEAGLASEHPEVRNWIMDYWARVPSAEHQELLNQKLVAFLKDKKGADLREMQSIFESYNVFRAENPNASFEAGTVIPTGWQEMGASSGTISLISNECRSFNKCLRINRTAVGTTSLQTSPVFQMEDLKSGGPVLEYGFSYHFGSDGDDGIVSDGDFVLKLKIEIAQPNGTTVNEIIIDRDYVFAWDEIGKQIHLSNPGIDSVKLTVSFQGKGEVFIDDVYVRRGKSDFDFTPVSAANITVSPGTIVVKTDSEHPSTVSLQASGFSGNVVTGHWISSLEGELGEGFNLQAPITKAGVHSITFVPVDDYGLEGEPQIETLNALMPYLSLTSSDAVLGTLSSGTVHFHIELQDNVAILPVTGGLYVNHNLVEAFSSFPKDISVNTRNYPNGLAFVSVKAIIQGIQLESNMVTFEIKN